MAETIRGGGRVTAPGNTEERLLQKRKFYIRFLVTATVIMLLLFNFGSWFFLYRIQHFLEQELEKRLVSIAGLMVRNINTDDVEAIMASEDERWRRGLIQPELARLLDEQELEAAYIIDRNNQVIIDDGRYSFLGDQRTYLNQDAAVIDSAWLGNISVSPIHVFEGNRFKNVYAPLTNEFLEVPAILVLEASADFFHILTMFRRGLIFSSLLSFGLIVIFAFFISWMITLLIRTHESLQQKEKLAVMGQMAASVAHEIRNPLGIIKGTADVLKEKYAEENTSDELFDYISDEVRRLNVLVGNFLSFAREPKLEPKKTDLIEVIEKAVAAMEREDQEKQVVITIDSTDKIEPFSFDPNAIQQVLFNLLINAFQAVDNSGTIQIQVEKILMKNKLFARVAVIDNGPGIKGDSQKVFEPFYTTKSSGSGLGLAICKQIVEKHNGRIEMESKKNERTVFRFYLPM